MKKTILLFCFILMSSYAFSQIDSNNTYRTISGYVYKNEKPISVYHVKLVKITGDPVFVTYPNKNGYFEFKIPLSYKGTLFLTLLVTDHKPLKKRLEFPLVEDLYYELILEYDGRGKYIINLWKDPDTIYECKKSM